ncbi:hypothetical protein [Marinimicrobium sp. ARAG 43.8]|uniref:hypothetical protein n=1 Tax=Marinimicrobium sp. ARAG 43.8 TaxID=3418719 RepID=UPI003CE8C22A
MPDAKSPQPVPQDPSLDLLNLDDDLAELGDRCAFLCDAVIALLKTDDCIDPSTLGGIHAYSDTIKGYIEQLRERLQRVRTQIPVDLKHVGPH